MRGPTKQAIISICFMLPLLVVGGRANAADEGTQKVAACEAGTPPLDMVTGCTKLLSVPGLDAPTKNNALGRRGMAYVQLRQFQAAIADFEALKSTAYSPQLGYLLSSLYLNAGRENDAITELTKLVDAGVADARAFGLRGAAYQNAGKFDESIEDFNKVLLLNPKDLVALNNRASAYAKKGDRAQAVKDLDAALAVDPNLAIALANKCDLLAKDGHFEQGFPSCQKAEQLEPDNGIILSAIASAYMHMDRYDDALIYMDRAVALMPGNPMMLYQRGLAKNKAGRKEDGDADIAEATRLKPDVAAMMERSMYK